MARIIFHGDLKRFSNEPLELEVDSFKELMSGLLSQIKGLQQHLRQGYYKVRVGKSTYLTEDQIKTNPVIILSEHCTVHFTPVLAGAGKGMGIGQIIVGAVLIATSWYMGGAAGWSYLGVQAGTTMTFAMGAAMMMSGAISLLTQMPDASSSYKESEKEQSTSFSNIKNLTPQGRPIPLLYGRMLTSLILISQGVETFDDMDGATA